MKRLLIAVVFLSQALWARDAGTFATKDFGSIERLAGELFQFIDPHEVLVVFDIDNTLLKLERDLGSEQWFLWQKELLDQKNHQLPLVADSLEDLLTVQSWIYHTYPMTLVTPAEGYWIHRLRQLGAATVALTSRSLNVHEATLREVYNNALELAKAEELGLDGNGYAYLPYSLENPEASGLSRSDIDIFKLGSPREVVFDQGVLLTQGQHKGAMLKTLMSRMQRKFKAVIFIDDRLGHIEAMRSMSDTVPQEIYSIHFNLSETWTRPFLQGDKTKTEKDWCVFADWLNREWFKDSTSRIYRSCLANGL